MLVMLALRSPVSELAVRDGELFVRARSCAAWQMSGSSESAGSATRAEPLQTSDGWLPTGDHASVDASGRVTLGGRRTTFLKVHGHRIDPLEIESFLRDLPGVGEVVVVGVPDDVAGQRIVACVEPSAGGDVELDVDELRSVCRKGLSATKLPTRFELVDQIPRTPVGKVDREAVTNTMSLK